MIANVLKIISIYKIRKHRNKHYETDYRFIYRKSISMKNTFYAVFHKRNAPKTINT